MRVQKDSIDIQQLISSARGYREKEQISDQREGREEEERHNGYASGRNLKEPIELQGKREDAIDEAPCSETRGFLPMIAY